MLRDQPEEEELLELPLFFLWWCFFEVLLEEVLLLA